ncbi:optic atrophy 3 protein homolog [Watersipora subatra]|uniref:optic atrophy 3 protein homolog n=1 Tax=Watersipora subatra TaxID=2589382 RepID=UPI00355BA9B2
MSSFPVIKLFSLFVKQISKPIAGYIKRRSKDNYWVRTYICIPPAQLYHRYDVRLRLWISGSTKGKKIQPLEEQQAINEGADLLGEMFVLSVACGLIGMEYYRQAWNAAIKEEQQDTSLTRLTKDMRKLRLMLNEQSDDIDELVRLIEVLSEKPLGVQKVVTIPNR